MLRRTTRLSIAILAALIATTTACSSGTTGQPAPGSTSASAQSTPAFPSESVPAGVQKDSVLDLNSTKDMTGVVTTVPIDKSPYVAHLPDICTFIPDSAIKQLGVDNKKRGFRGTQLISQACTMQHLNAGDVDYTVTVNFFTNSLKEISEPSRADILQRGITIGPKVSAVTLKVKSTGPDDENYRQVCGATWGTFFGAIVVNYRTYTPQTVDPCTRSIEAARIVAPFMPKSPSEMRPAP